MKFLTQAAQYILEKHGNELSDVSLLLPNNRACLYMREEIRKQVTGTAWMPQIETLQSRMMGLSDAGIVHPLELIYELYSSYTSNGGTQEFDPFLPTARTLLTDFEEIDYNLAEPEQFFHNLELLQSMKTYVPGEEELSEYSKQYRNFWTLFRTLYMDLNTRLKASNRAYPAMVMRNVAEQVDSLVSLNANEPCYFIGFSGFTKAEEHFVRFIIDKNHGELLWDTDEYYLNSSVQEAGYFFRKYREEWRAANALPANQFLTSTAKNVHLIGVAKNIGQAKAVADILHNKLRLTQETEPETVVVFPDENLLQPMQNYLPDSITSYNISMGLPLADTTVAAFFQLLFTLHTGLEKYSNSASGRFVFYHADIIALLQHSFAEFLAKDSSVIPLFIEKIKLENKVFIPLEYVLDYFQNEPQLCRSLFMIETAPIAYFNCLKTLTETLRNRLVVQHHEGVEGANLAIEFLFRIQNSLNNMLHIIESQTAVLSIKTLRRFLLDEWKTVRIPFEGEPVAGIQLMGIMETRCLDYKNVIILSMNEGLFPSGKNQKTYIPFEMRRAFLTTQVEKDSISAYLFYRLLQRAENVYLLYNTESDSLGGGEKSRYILQLQQELKAANPSVQITEQFFSINPETNLQESEISLEKTPELIANLQKRLTEKGISPSALNTLVNCNLQYYFRYLLGLREEDEMEESIEANTLGTAVHYALCEIYKPMLGQPLTVAYLDSVLANENLLNSLLTTGFEQRFEASALKSGKNYLLFKISAKIVRKFLLQERENVEELSRVGKQISVLQVEEELRHTLVVNGVPILLKGVLDRVETVGNTLRIADYKTGTSTKLSLNEEQFSDLQTEPKHAKALQLLAYAFLYQQNNLEGSSNIQSGIYWLRKISTGFDSLKIGKEEVITRSILQQFEAVLQAVLSDLLNPEIPFTKTEDVKRCVHCEFVGICQRST